MKQIKNKMYILKEKPSLVINHYKLRNWTSKIIKCIYDNKIIAISIGVFFICVVMNLVLIYNFMRILKQI